MPSETQRATGGGPGSAAFQAFLDRLCGRTGPASPAEYNHAASRPAFVARVDALLDAMETSPPLRETCLAIAADATISCGDRLGLALNDMEIARINDDARQGRYSDLELFRLGRGMYRLSVLERIAIDTIQQQALRQRYLDPIEIRLAYQTKLAAELDLPGVSHAMLYPGEAHLSRHDFRVAAGAVRALERETGGIEFLAEWQPWQEAMKRRNPEAYSRVERSIQDQQEAFSILPESLSSQVQRTLYDGVSSRTRAAIIDFTRMQTVVFISENESALPP